MDWLSLNPVLLMGWSNRQPLTTSHEEKQSWELEIQENPNTQCHEVHQILLGNCTNQQSDKIAFPYY